MRDVPLSGQYIVVVADPPEISLFPFAAVNKRNVGGRKIYQRVVCGEIRDNCVRILSWVTHDIGHWCFAPGFINAGVTCFTSSGIDVMSGARGGFLFRNRGNRIHRNGLWQIANIRNQFPSLSIRQLPARHASVADAIADKIKEFAICPIPLHKSGVTQIKWLGIQPTTGNGFPAAIVSVAYLAMRLVLRMPGSSVWPGGTVIERVFEGLCLVGDTEVYQPLCEGCFESRGRLAGPQATRNDVVIQDNNSQRANNGKPNENTKKPLSERAEAGIAYHRIDYQDRLKHTSDRVGHARERSAARNATRRSPGNL